MVYRLKQEEKIVTNKQKGKIVTNKQKELLSRSLSEGSVYLSGDTLVSTDLGDIPIKDLKKGDRVVSSDMSSHPIVAIY